MPQPDSLVIEPAFLCGHVESGVVVLETLQDGMTVRHRLPTPFMPHRGLGMLFCFVCERFVNPDAE